MLRKFLKAGLIKGNELFSTNIGISMCTSLSPILGNMLLDGMQSYIYDRLYPDGGVNYVDGSVIRFADDTIITTSSVQRADMIMQIIMSFLSERGLEINTEKSCIADLESGFDFLSRYYRKSNGVLTVTPAENAVIRLEQELQELIDNYNGTQRTLIEKLNRKLGGWGNYHRVEDAYMTYRYIDAVVEGLLVNKMCRKYSHWHKETVLNRFWIKIGHDHIFALPNDPSIHVMQLSGLRPVTYRPCRTGFNPYLDDNYIYWLQNRRSIQMSSGKYKAVWNRQGGKCAYCGQPMLADDEIDVVEKVLGRGRKAQNLMYIHTRYAHNTVETDVSDEPLAGHIDLFSLLDGILDDAPAEDSPYLELTEYFRLCDKTPFTLSFHDIEQILGDKLDWEAYFYESFWLDAEPGCTSPMWRDEGFPFHTLLPSTPDYCIAESWLSQGYKLKALHMDRQKAVFRRTAVRKSGLTIPKALTEQKIPDAAVYELNEFFKHIIKKYGL